MIEKNFITSGRNTLIHKIRKVDLLILNGGHPVIIVSNRGIGIYNGEVPRKKSDAKKAYQDVVDVASTDVFGEEKTLVFIQALDNKEYKVDYSKVGTNNFIRIHQENYT
ncbi:hypothetical protein AADZ91_16875 [Colwelliaceae bacterium 6441]